MEASRQGQVSVLVCEERIRLDPRILATTTQMGRGHPQPTIQVGKRGIPSTISRSNIRYRMESTRAPSRCDAPPPSPTPSPPPPAPPPDRSQCSFPAREPRRAGRSTPSPRKTRGLVSGSPLGAEGWPGEEGGVAPRAATDMGTLGCGPRAGRPRHELMKPRRHPDSRGTGASPMLPKPPRHRVQRSGARLARSYSNSPSVIPCPAGG